MQAPDSISGNEHPLRKYYACFTDLFIGTHAGRLFHAKQIPVEPVQHRNPRQKRKAGENLKRRAAPSGFTPTR